MNFLMDERVIDGVPKILRNILVRGIYFATRNPKNLQGLRRKFWWEEGSPLMVSPNDLQKKCVSKPKCPVA